LSAERFKLFATKPIFWFWVGVFALLVSVASAAIARGDFQYFVIVFGGFLFVALPAAIVGVSFRTIGRKIRCVGLESTGLLFLSLSFSLLLQLLGLFFADQFARADIRKAKVFCESLVPKIEAWKQEHGNYPATIESVFAKDVRLPRLTRNVDSNGIGFYQGTSTNYCFFLHDPGSIFSGWLYFSETRTWSYD